MGGLVMLWQPRGLLQPGRQWRRGQGAIVPTNPGVLLHFNGADGSTTFVDSSGNDHIVTPAGDTQIDTAQSKFGGASIMVNSAHFDLDGDSDFSFGTGDFTIDLWARLTDPNDRFFWELRGVTDDGLPMLLVRTGTNAISLYNNWEVSSDKIIGSTALSANTWYHIAVTRASGVWRLFLNGTQEGSTYTAGTLQNMTIPANRPRFGAAFNVGAFAGWMDEVRIIKGVAAWTANFTPPSSEYTNLTP
jgi:Concanavalin A-like lectin/glucanases superfamily